MTSCSRGRTGHGCRYATTRGSSPRSARRRDSRRSRWAKCGSEHLSDARGGYRRRRGRRMARTHRKNDSGCLRAGDRRPADRRVGGFLGPGGRTELGHVRRYHSRIAKKSQANSLGFLMVELRGLEPLTPTLLGPGTQREQAIKHRQRAVVGVVLSATVVSVVVKTVVAAHVPLSVQCRGHRALARLMHIKNH